MKPSVLSYNSRRRCDCERCPPVHRQTAASATYLALQAPQPCIQYIFKPNLIFEVQPDDTKGHQCEGRLESNVQSQIVTGATILAPWTLLTCPQM